MERHVYTQTMGLAQWGAKGPHLSWFQVASILQGNIMPSIRHEEQLNLALVIHRECRFTARYLAQKQILPGWKPWRASKAIINTIWPSDLSQVSSKTWTERFWSYYSAKRDFHREFHKKAHSNRHYEFSNPRPAGNYRNASEPWEHRALLALNLQASFAPMFWASPIFL